MKFRKLFCGLFGLCLVGLAGCNKEPTEPTNPVIPNEEDTTPIIIPTVDWDSKDYICKGGSYGEYFSDVNVERMLCVGTSYLFSFESSHSADKSYTVKVSNPSVAEVSVINIKKFNLVCKSAGDIILTIENADEILVYRNIVRIRDPIATDKMNDYLKSVERFEVPKEFAAYFGEYKLSFDYLDEFGGAFAGTLKGSDDYDSNIFIIFTLEYEMFLDDRDCYSYKLTQIYTETYNTFIGYLNISRAGDWLYLYEDEELGTGGLLTMLVPYVLE